MTVGELIERLEFYDRNMRVVVSGFDEGGYDDLKTIDVIGIKPYNLQGTHMPKFDDGQEEQALWLDF